MVAQQLAAMPEEPARQLQVAFVPFVCLFCHTTLVVGMKMPDHVQLMTLEQLRKACSDAPRGVPLLVAEAIWRRDLVQKIGHQSYPSWFEAALKRYGTQLHRELYLKEDPSEPVKPSLLSHGGPNGFFSFRFQPDWQDELQKQQRAMRQH